MKRKLLILSLLVILAALTAAGTLAYYTDSARTHNVITSGKVNIALHEWADKKHKEPFRDKTGVMPGTKVTKIVEVENTGTGAAFVRLRVETEVLSAEGVKMGPQARQPGPQSDRLDLSGRRSLLRPQPAARRNHRAAVQHRHLCCGNGQQISERHGPCESQRLRRPVRQQRGRSPERGGLAVRCAAGTHRSAHQSAGTHRGTHRRTLKRKEQMKNEQRS